MPTYLTEDRHDGGYIVWEPANGSVTRREAILLSGAGKCMAGLVLGKVGHALTGTVAGLGTNAGNPTFTAIVVGAGGLEGDYVITFIDADDFTVSEPGGEQIGHGDLGTPFAAAGMAFSPAAGGTPAQAGDTWRITVAAGSGKYVAYDPTGADGREVAAAILFGGRDATAADKKCVVNDRGPMRVNAGELVWGAGVTTNQHKLDAYAALLALPGGGIQVSA